MSVGGLARLQMTMRADITRNSTASTDAYGQPGVPVFAAHLSDVACCVWSRRRQERNDDRKFALLEEIVCSMPVGTDVTEGDQIDKVTDRLDVTIWDGPLRIDTIQHKHDHLEMNLRRVQS